MIISKTPFRMSLFGGGTDYNDWFENNGGIVLSVGLAHYCYISVRYLPPFFNHKYRIVWSHIETVKKLKNIKSDAGLSILVGQVGPTELVRECPFTIPARS